MGIAQAFIGDIVSLIMFALVVAGVMKVFQIAGDLREMKDFLRDLKRNAAQVPAPLAAAAPAASPVEGTVSLRPTMTPEELVRAVHAQRFTDDDFPMLETIPPPQP